MKIRYYAETDTLYIEFRDVHVAETRELDENMLLDVDTDGDICALTIEHASKRSDRHLEVFARLKSDSAVAELASSRAIKA